MSPRPEGRPLFALFWRMYIVLGVISAGAGLLFFSAPGLLYGGAGSERNLIRVIAVIFVIFGVARIVNAVIQLRKLGHTRSGR